MKSQFLEVSFHTLVEAIANAVILVNKEGHIVYANNQTEKLFGYDRSEITEKPIEILIPKRYH